MELGYEFTVTFAEHDDFISEEFGSNLSDEQLRDAAFELLCTGALGRPDMTIEVTRHPHSGSDS